VHKLLEKQLSLSCTNGVIDLARLSALVSGAYHELDRDRRRTDHSIALMIEELDRTNSALEDLVALRTDEVEHISRRLQATLAHVDQGIVMIDADSRVVVHNARFVALTGLTDAMLAGHPPFQEIVDMMCRTGEFSPMGTHFTSWIKAHGCKAGPQNYQRIRPDGTILHVQSTPLPDGGEVQTMADVTGLARRTEELDLIRETLEAILENMSQGIIKVDAERNIRFFNRRAIALLGLPEGFLEHGQTLQSLLEYQIESGEFANMDPGFVAFVKGGGIIPTPQVYERERPNGTILEIRTILLPDGSAVRTYTDITEQRRRESALKRAEEDYRGLFENAIVGIYRTSMDGRHIRANPAFARMNGYESEAEMLAALQAGADWYVDPERREAFFSLLMRDGRISDFVSEVYRLKTRERFWASEASWLVRDADGAPLYIEGMVIDATDRKKAEDDIAHIALHDLLTGLPNRSRFLDRLRSSIARNEDGHEIAVLCLDLDHFKDVNDTMGHDCGDILLRLASRRLSRALPQGGMASRFGGDEFAVLLPDIKNRDSVTDFARLAVQQLSKPYRIRGKRVYVGVSIGIVMAPGDGVDAHDLLKKADIALYRVKRDGRGTYACFDVGMTAAILARREVELELRRAITNHEFEMVYQPIIDLETNQPLSYEALIRWNHPQKGVLSPAAFIDIAEESGLIIEIGEIALRDACTTIARASSELGISVNLSPVQFRNHQLALTVIHALAQSGLPPHRLILEITESALLTDDQHTLDILQHLRMLGVRIALDDFGIGHSSLSYLQKFPFDKIKIDKSFVKDSDDGTMNTAIRRAILGLGSDLGAEVIVEGVETEFQRDMLIYEGCRYAQGYLFGRPAARHIVFGDTFRRDAA